MEKKKPNSYCEFVQSLPSDNIHKVYHNNQYGFPIDSDDELFGRLLLEINQAGLNWTTILNKQENFRKAFEDFSIQAVANFKDQDINRLLTNEGIIRNRRKIEAAIYNAQKIVEIQDEYGSFKNWLTEFHPQTLEEWVKLFKKTFKFTGGEITKEFLTSSGYLKGAHITSCPSYNEVLKQKPKWNIK